jgi:hypothetical protein
MTVSSYPHHMGYVAILATPADILAAQRDCADWHWVARYNLDAFSDTHARANAISCQTYSARASRAVRAALGIE